MTYFQVDKSKFSTRESSRTMSEAEFNAGSSALKVDYWAHSREEHQNDGFHCHCVLKLTDCNKCQSKIELHKNMVFKSILVTSIISIFLHTGMSVKVTKR